MTSRSILESLKQQITGQPIIDKDYKPELKIQSTIDEGKGMSNIERQVHVYHEVKGLIETKV